MYVYLNLSLHMPHMHSYNSKYICYTHVYMLYIWMCHVYLYAAYTARTYITAYHCIIDEQTYMHLQLVICYTPMYAAV